MPRKQQADFVDIQSSLTTMTQTGDNSVQFGQVSGGTIIFNYNTPQDRLMLVALITEAGGTCLGDCGTKLGFPKNDMPVDNCELVYVNPKGEAARQEYSNAVALCVECAREFPTWEDVQKAALLERKHEKSHETEALHELAKLPLKRQIKDVVRKFNARRRTTGYIVLVYDPVEVDKKIPDSLLRDTTRDYVSRYFYTVDGILSQISEEDDDFDIEDFAEQIKQLYRTAKKKLNTQEGIFDALVETLFQSCGGGLEYRRVCEVVIAYYVQSCEVFEVPKEVRNVTAK